MRRMILLIETCLLSIVGGAVVTMGTVLRSVA